MQYTRILLFFQFLLFCKQYTISNANPLIGNNIRRARPREFPFIVSIITRDFRGFDALRDHLCTGTLITKQHVITAEHCMCSNIFLCQVIAGSINLYQGRRYNIKAWISYIDWIKIKLYYLEYEENDISILTLRDPIDDPEIQPASLSTLTNEQLNGLDVVVAGWGRTDTQQLAIIMETAMLKIISKKTCLKRVEKISPSSGRMVVPDSVICSVADPYTLLDNGESGGPLLDTNNYLIGVNEGTTPKNDRPFHPKEVNVHANINYYRHFIMDVISHSN